MAEEAVVLLVGVALELRLLDLAAQPALGPDEAAVQKLRVRLEPRSGPHVAGPLDDAQRPHPHAPVDEHGAAAGVHHGACGDLRVRRQVDILGRHPVHAILPAPGAGPQQQATVGGQRAGRLLVELPPVLEDGTEGAVPGLRRRVGPGRAGLLGRQELARRRAGQTERDHLAVDVHALAGRESLEPRLAQQQQVAGDEEQILGVEQRLRRRRAEPTQRRPAPEVKRIGRHLVQHALHETPRAHAQLPAGTQRHRRAEALAAGGFEEDHGDGPGAHALPPGWRVGRAQPRRAALHMQGKQAPRLPAFPLSGTWAERVG